MDSRDVPVSASPVLACWRAGITSAQMQLLPEFSGSDLGPSAPKASSLLMEPAQSQDPHFNCPWVVDMHMILKVAAMKNF